MCDYKHKPVFKWKWNLIESNYFSFNTPKKWIASTKNRNCQIIKNITNIFESSTANFLSQNAKFQNIRKIFSPRWIIRF